MSSNNLCKVFVGNVPFECDIEDFQKCFNMLDGFTKAEIIYKPGTTVSRGFGFILFDSPENARKIINRSDIFFKNRCLRFTEYTFDEKKAVQQYTSHDIEINSCDNRNYILVKNIGNTTTRDELKTAFSSYEPIGRYFIVSDASTGESKGFGVVEITNKTKFDKLLEEKYIASTDGTIFEVAKWKLQKNIDHEKKITKNDLHQAFIAGRNVGIIETLRISKIKNCFKY